MKLEKEYDFFNFKILNDDYKKRDKNKTKPTKDDDEEIK